MQMALTCALLVVLFSILICMKFSVMFILVPVENITDSKHEVCRKVEHFEWGTSAGGSV